MGKTEPGHGLTRRQGKVEIQMLDDIKDPRRAPHTFKIAVTGVAAAFQVTNPEEKEHSSVDQAAWISNLEEALAKAIAQIILARKSESDSK